MSGNSEGKLFVELSGAALGDDVSVDYLHGTEGISELYEYQIVFTSPNRGLDAEKILGSSATVHFNCENHERFINGIISNFSQGTTSLKDDIYFTEYSIIVRPKLWLLSLDNNCKMFQKKTAMDIIKSVLKDGGVADISDKTSTRGRGEREYCVQYNESSFNFVSRLMEDEGIFYYFTHEKGKHILVLTDSSNSYPKVTKQSDVEFFKARGEEIPLGKIFNVSRDSSMHIGGYSLADYNYQISQTKLFSKMNSQWKGGIFYEYPGGFAKAKEGEDLSKLRVQELEFCHLLLHGDSTVPAFIPGATFQLKAHHSENFNAPYVLYRAEHEFRKSGEGGFVYRNHFTAFPKDTEFRAPRKTPKPKIYGNQTAIVVCPSGKEIYRNEHCAVKVHFHWDQEGKSKDSDDSSCWIRVAQLWAGSNWGGIFIPRVGQEVVVSFSEGDPDRPLIVGCVYNDYYMPPYPDSDAKKSTLKSVSYENEQGFNEFRIDDEKDKEEIYLHAQKDMYVDIINSRKTEIEESDDSLDIFKGSRTTTLHAKGDSPGNYSLELKKGDKSVLLQEGNSSYVLKKGDSTVKLENGNQTVDIKGDCTVKISGNLTVKVDGDISVKAGKSIKIESGTTTDIKAGTAITEKAGTALSCKAGTEMKLEATTNWTAKALNVNIQATMNLSAKANMNVDIQSSMNVAIKSMMMLQATGMVGIKLTGVVTEISGAATVKITSALAQIGTVIKIG